MTIPNIRSLDLEHINSVCLLTLLQFVAVMILAFQSHQSESTKSRFQDISWRCIHKKIISLINIRWYPSHAPTVKQTIPCKSTTIDIYIYISPLDFFYYRSLTQICFFFFSEIPLNVCLWTSKESVRFCFFRSLNK